jgi:glycosyltransferase involved in cell wall biosynthesis
MKVLLSAYSCAPNMGSEPEIGWNWARCIAENEQDVTVITRSVNRQVIETCQRGRFAGRLRFAFHDLSPLAQKLYWLPCGNYLYYLLWQYTAAKFAESMHRRECFDRVQHITWGSFRVPSFMGRLKIPFTFGPVAGGEDAPPQLRKGMGFRGRLWDLARRISNYIVAGTPLMRSTYRNATEIITTTEETRRQIPASYRHKCKVHQAVGVDPLVAGPNGRLDLLRASGTPRARLEILYVGRLLPWKGLHLALKALAQLKLSASSDIHFTIIGSGYDHARLKRLAARLSLQDCVTWIPWMHRSELLAAYPDFDLFLFPSLHDSGGLAVLEALHFGLPVICLDLGGPAVSVNSSCGVVIPAAQASEPQIIKELAQSILRFLQDPARLEKLSRGARLRAAQVTWNARIRSVYSPPSKPSDVLGAELVFS